MTLTAVAVAGEFLLTSLAVLMIAWAGVTMLFRSAEWYDRLIFALAVTVLVMSVVIDR